MSENLRKETRIPTLLIPEILNKEKYTNLKVVLRGGGQLQPRRGPKWREVANGSNF